MITKGGVNFAGMEVKPCNGRNPILDPVTGYELDCGSGPNRKDCPSDSYCHHTSKFARCCAKGSLESKFEFEFELYIYRILYIGDKIKLHNLLEFIIKSE